MADDLCFDAEAFELRRNGEVVAIEPQALTVAAYLIENRNRLISKEELLDEVWGNRFVSESTLSTRIKQIRRAVGDSGTEQRVIKTVHGRGYRFIGDIVVGSPEGGAGQVDAETQQRNPERPLQNLPRLRTEVVGREVQVEAAASSVDRHRLTTLVGVGGVGKTTLATAVGYEVFDAFPDGVWFVDLVPVEDVDQLVLALAKAAGLSLRTGPPLEQVASIVADRQVLFILDNCENALEGVTSTVDFLLDATSAPRFLLTSREVLGLADEARVVVDTLSTAGPTAPAVELLNTCAERYGVTDLDPTLAGEVCRELDGLPLAIELAAAQLRHLTLEDLASRLDQRFSLLAVSRSDRHASLATVLESTWASISHTERELLRQLSASPQPLGLDGLIANMDQPEETTLNALARLVDCSLLVRSRGADSRYRMLETVRLFARDSDDVDQQSARRDRLAAWCLERVGTDVTRHAFDFRLAQWCASHDGVIDAAEVHLASNRPDEAAMLIAGQGLTMHVDDGGRAADVLTRIDQHLARVNDPDLRARLHITGAFSAMAARDPSLLAVHGGAAVGEARRRNDPSILAISLVLASWSEVRQPERALELVTEAAAIAEAAGDLRTFDLTNGYRAWNLALMRNYDEAVQVASGVLAREEDDPGYNTMSAAAALATSLAISDPRRSLEIYEHHLNRPLASSMVANELLLASAHAANADMAETARIVWSVHQRLRRSGQHSFPDVLVPVAILARALGDTDRAHAYLSAVRHSERPTQNLQVTCLYQQLRQLSKGGPVDTKAADASSTPDEVGGAALDWLTTLEIRS